MMEVKHSPATQMEFRSNRNGLSDTVEDELETLFEEGTTKPAIPKADKCDEKLPILNGVSKCLEKSDSIKDLDEIDIDLDLQKDEHDETAAEKEDSEVFDLDLEPESAGETQNGEVTDASKVRDTGDDLDTLLSKINDLVEDCMDKPKVSVAKANADDVVEIADDDLDDDVKDEVKSEVKDSAEASEVQAGVQKATAVNVKKQGTPEKEDSVKESMDCTSDKMDVDDFVFCLDSPLDESRSQGEEMPEAEEVLETAEEEVKLPKKEETSVSTAPTDKETVQSKPSEEEDDDVFLIEDDEDEEAMMEIESTGIEDEELNKEIEDIQSESKKELDKDADKDCNEVADDKSKEGAKVEADVSEPMNEEDDDIVCLDDSNEAIEEKEDEPSAETSASKAVDAAVESRKEEADQEVEKPSVNAEDPVTEEAETESVEEESAIKVVVVEEEQTVENASDADETPPPVLGCAKLAKEAEEPVPNPEKSSPVIEDDDVVILDDDDEQSEAIPPVTSTTPDKPIDQPSDSCGILDEAKASEEEKATEEEVTSDKGSIVESSTIIPDNSDNARDGVDEKDDNDVAKQTPKETSVSAESNSCSASDSLLKESKKGTRTEAEENNEQPPTKKLRLSQDESNSRLSIISHEESKSNTPDNDNDEVMDDSKSLKRVRSTESISADFKKPKTEAEAETETEPELEKVDDTNSIDSKDIKESKEDICKVEIKHLPLYPPPKLEPPTIDLSLDFLKRFKKTIHKMTKSDLEELVLQKIVEAIVHKSEFSEMRELIEKQDKIIAGHRTKITELNKQFRDLEMVHNRVLKDLETKNAQFVMPVKITRAVGLQVFFPAKKFDPTLMPLAPQNTAPVPSPHTPRSLVNHSAHSSDRSSHSSPVAVSNNTPKSSTSTSSQAASSSSVQQQAPPQRRGCVQKLTPLRPDTPRNSPLNRSISAGVVSSSTPSPSTSKEYTSKFAPRPVGPKTRVTPVSVVGNVTSKVSVTVSPNDPAPPEQPKKFKPVPMHQHKTKSVLKRHPQHGNSDPQTVAQPLPAAALIVAPAIPPAVAPTGALKSGQKSVIDLTDEDDVIPSAPAPSSKLPAAPAAQVSTTPQTSAAPSGTRPYKVSVVPQQQLQQPKPNIPKQVQQRPIVPAPSKPNGVANRQLSATPSRYRHPAPLPNQPIQSSNPAWKLPPARPTIRISNLESGIVISWTIEDTTKDKYAESTSYQIYAYQETSGPPLVESWRHVGDVKAMLLPMAVTLTQFQEGQRYYFAVRAVDAHNRCGPFSFAKTWS